MTEFMTAAVIERFGGPDALTIAQVPRPDRLNDEVLVEIHAAGVDPFDASARAGQGSAVAIDRFPAVLGCDFSGTVVETPYAAHSLRPGDAVYGVIPVPRYAGSYAEYASVPSLCIAPKPVGLSHVEAAAVPLAALTAWGIVTTLAKAHERQRVLIHGGETGAGHFAVQFAAYFGAHVIATASARNLEWLRGLGARETIDPVSASLERELDPVDVVIDLSDDGDDLARSRALALVRSNGLVVSGPTGSLPTRQTQSPPTGARTTAYHASPDGATLAVISRLLEQGSVRPHVDEIFGLPDASAAHARLESGDVRGKLVIAHQKGE
ncbi:NADP-dependent oxidoreductase [Gryllotalpicola daejeonensis]|uniref:NADP-dependent oxidoreductase n=1 Tax=Gryllotalpicola daejeonensis TaxID=993087 RepID=UPI0031DFF529